MSYFKWILPAFAAATLAGAAQAADEEACGKGLVCANAPQTVVDGLQRAGFKALLEKDGDGDPKITSAANGYNFTIYFHECKENAHCASLHFSTGFADDGKNTAELANLWNKQYRFSQMAVDDDGSLDLTYDVTTLGGLNQRNFADVVDWWQTMLGVVNGFFRKQGHID